MVLRYTFREHCIMGHIHQAQWCTTCGLHKNLCSCEHVILNISYGGRALTLSHLG